MIRYAARFTVLFNYILNIPLAWPTTFYLVPKRHTGAPVCRDTNSTIWYSIHTIRYTIYYSGKQANIRLIFVNQIISSAIHTCL